MSDAFLYASIDELTEIVPNGEDEIDSAVRIEAIRRELAKALEKLPETQRTAIVLRYFEELSDKLAERS